MRRLAVFSGEGDFGRGAVSGFVGGLDLEFACFGDLVSGVEGLEGASCRGEGDIDGAGGGFVVFPGGDGFVTDFEGAAGDGDGGAGDDVHGTLGDRDGRSVGVLGGSGLKWLIAAAGDGESQRKEYCKEVMESAHGVSCLWGTFRPGKHGSGDQDDDRYGKSSLVVPISGRQPR